jgi:replication factor C subunit 2/4
MDDVAGQEDVTRMLASADGADGHVPSMVLCGPPGTGKTTVVRIMLRRLFGDQASTPERVLHVNASHETGIDVLRGKVQTFAVGDGPSSAVRRVVVLEEADMLTLDFQFALRCVMERAGANGTRFFLACNYSSRIIDAIKSRCAVFHFKALGPEVVGATLGRIAAAEGVELQPAVRELLQQASGGDLRRAVTSLQMLVCTAGRRPSVEDAAQATDTVPHETARQLWCAIAESPEPGGRVATVLRDLLRDGPYSGAAVVAALLEVVLGLPDCAAGPVTPAVAGAACVALAECDHALADGGSDLAQMLGLIARLWCATHGVAGNA